VSKLGTASAYGNNDAGWGDRNKAGNDKIVTGKDDDTVSGGAQAVAKGDAYAEQNNHAGGKGQDDDRNQAGDDTIYAGNGENVVAGDAQAISSHDDAKAKSHNHAEKDDDNSAGNDKIVTGWNDDVIAGDAQAVADKHAESDSF